MINIELERNLIVSIFVPKKEVARRRKRQFGLLYLGYGVPRCLSKLLDVLDVVDLIY